MIACTVKGKKCPFNFVGKCKKFMGLDNVILAGILSVNKSLAQPFQAVDTSRLRGEENISCMHNP